MEESEEEAPPPQRVIFPGQFAAPEPEAPEEEAEEVPPPPPPEPSVEELVSRAIDEVREEEQAARTKRACFPDGNAGIRSRCSARRRKNRHRNRKKKSVRKSRCGMWRPLPGNAGSVSVCSCPALWCCRC